MMAIESSKRPETMSKLLTQRHREDEEMNSRIIKDDELGSRGTTIYSYINSHYRRDTTGIVQALLGLGTRPDLIDTRLWKDYTKEPEIEVAQLHVPGGR